MGFTKAQLLEEKQKHETWLQQQPGLVGTGVGSRANGELCLVIYTDRMPRLAKEGIRKRLGEVSIEFEESGEFRAFGDAT